MCIERGMLIEWLWWLRLGISNPPPWSTWLTHSLWWCWWWRWWWRGWWWWWGGRWWRRCLAIFEPLLHLIILVIVIVVNNCNHFHKMTNLNMHCMTCGLRYALRIATCGNALDSVFHAGKSKILPQLAKVGTTMEFKMRCFYSGDDKKCVFTRESKYVYFLDYIHTKIHIAWQSIS